MLDRTPDASAHRPPDPAPADHHPAGSFAGDHVLVTGGAGFVGTNLSAAFLADGVPVRVLDDLSRPGVVRNADRLRDEFGRDVTFVRADVRDADAVARAVAGAGRVYHLAAQVAVTTGLADPVADFEVNARGTLNVLEACRRRRTPPPLLFTSTNKVYGDLGGVELVRDGGRYRPADPDLAAGGVGEDRPLDFHSPYGCSKGAADQYVLDYARSYGLPATVFRMSCIYGPHQHGTEDQGWVAHFARRVLRGGGVTFYGDGRQVRDVLHADDLVRAMRRALDRPEVTAGRAFNVGGGPGNAVSLRDVVDRLADLNGRRVPVRRGPWRVGDQRWYVSDTAAVRRALGWEPRVGPREGLERLYDWLAAEVGRAPAAGLVPA